MNWIITGSDNGLGPVQCQAIIWTSAIRPQGTQINAILFKIQKFSLKKLHEYPFSTAEELFLKSDSLNICSLYVNKIDETVVFVLLHASFSYHHDDQLASLVKPILNGIVNCVCTIVLRKGLHVLYLAVQSNWLNKWPCFVQSGAVITWSNITWYFIQYCSSSNIP